ncbi:hypothetical protein IKS86_02485 [bacterium]|nr:hypothetical protein [bacterium]
MKKLVLIPLFLMFFVSFLAADSWDCSADTDCPEGTTCDSTSNSCVMTKGKIADYATITLSIGENSPSALGADRIYVTQPATDLVLGQLAVNSYTGGGEGQLYFIKELSVDLAVYPSTIIFENFKLIHDANGNGVADSSERVVAEGIPEGFGMKFEIEQKYQAFKMNQTENFLIVGSFSSEKEITDSKFNATVKSNYIKTKTYTGEGAVAATADIVFPSFAFEPEKGYFLLSSGKNFPKAPTWKEMNKEQEIMHLRLKALDGANDLLTLKIELYGTAVSFGNGVEKIALCTDPNGSGKCGEVIAELSDFVEPQQSVSFQIPAGKVSLNAGEEKYLVVKAGLNFYQNQNTYFFITESDVTLKTRQKIAGTPIKTESFKYSCKEDDPDCRLKPEEPTEESSDSGCSLLFVD